MQRRATIKIASFILCSMSLYYFSQGILASPNLDTERSSSRSRERDTPSAVDIH